VAQDGTMPLSPRQVLVKGRKYRAAAGGHYLTFQADGNLVVSNGAGQKVWGLDQVVKNIKAQTVQVGDDGNLVARGPNNQFLWSALSANPDPRGWVDLTPAGVLQVGSDRRGVQWASDGKLSPPRPLGPTCAPYERLATCVTIANPKIKIMATKAVSPSALALVKQIYTDMTAFLQPRLAKNTLDGFVVYLTNDEPWAQLKGMGPIGPDIGANDSGAELRGGAARDYLWITEEMICKTGVKTRGPKDKEARTFDQVIHEFAHSIEANYGFSDRVRATFPQANPMSEAFAWATQAWFSVPAGALGHALTDAEKKFMSEIFTKQKTYACAAYKPS